MEPRALHRCTGFAEERASTLRWGARYRRATAYACLLGAGALAGDVATSDYPFATSVYYSIITGRAFILHRGELRSVGGGISVHMASSPIHWSIFAIVLVIATFTGANVRIVPRTSVFWTL